MAHRCLFCEFAEGKTRCNKVYEDEDTFAFIDWTPWDEVHVVAFPKVHIGLRERENPLFGQVKETLARAVPAIAAAARIAEGYAILDEEDEGSVGQNEEHLHIHITGKKEKENG